MSEQKESKKWSKYAETYDPIRVGSIDGKPEQSVYRSIQFHFNLVYYSVGTDTYPHDNGISRAMQSHYKPNERVVGKPRYTIFVGRLHIKTDEVKIATAHINIYYFH